METKKPSSIDLSELYSVRMMVLVEREPQGNEYLQVLLDPSQYKRMGKALDALFPRCRDCGGTEMTVGRRSIVLPDLPDIHRCKGECEC